MRNFLEECITDLGQQKKDYRAFQETFCVRCRNRECDHAKWAADKFSARVATQPDRFFNPLRDDPKNPKYAQLVDFTNVLREAIRLDIANKRGDWEIPEIPILDGVDETAARQTTSAVDQAAISLAKSRDKNLIIPDPEDIMVRNLEKETQVLLSEHPTVPVDDTPVKNDPTPEPKKTPLGNTPVAPHGIMVGEGPRPTTPLPVKQDDWAVPSAKVPVVKPGSKIQMGKK